MSVNENRPILTDHQTELLFSVASGKTEKEIATDKRRSIQTIKNTLGLVYRRLEAKNKTHAVVIGISLGILNLNEIPIVPKRTKSSGR